MTVDEQIFARYTLYTVRLQFASGAQQTIVVTAPPGGLQPEMRDMSGDSVPNDLVLLSGLLRLPMVVLLNEGHDHLSLAISPGSFANGEGRVSGWHQIYRAMALRSSGFKSLGLTNNGQLFLSRRQGGRLSSVAANLSNRLVYLPSSERAPPARVTQI